MVVIVFGLPGSGKSYFAERVAAMLNAAYISSDIIRKKLLEKPTYTPDEKLLIYDEMGKLMKKVIDDNRHAVLDATFHKNKTRQRFIEEAEKYSRVFAIEVWADEEIIKERTGRERENSDADFEVYKKLAKEWQPLNEEHLVLQSTNNNINQMLEKTAGYIFLTNEK